MKKVIDFIKETFPYIIIGMLGTYIYADYKLDGKRLPSSVQMPYVNQENLDNDTYIRNATRGGSKGQIEGRVLYLEEI
ncbi:MAG: hypothetical protein KIB00_16820 [Paeniclostridium sordellii]|nr:hypothetical protein [Paeniclostridium sordellii]